MRAVPVVMAGVLAGDGPQVPFGVDKHPVGALGSCAAYPPPGIAVRSWCPRRGPDRLHALAGEDLVEGAGDLGVGVPDEEAEGPDPVTEVDEQVTGLLGGPCAARAGGHAEDVHPPGCYLHDEQHVQALEEDRVHVKEIAGQQAISLRAQERSPRSVQVRRDRPAPPGAQDPPYRRLADVGSEPAQFTLHSAVSPGRVLPRQPPYQVTDLLAGSRTT